MKLWPFPIPLSLVLMFGSLIGGVIWIGYSAHKDDARLKQECEAKGGQFVETREPLHVCVPSMARSSTVEHRSVKPTVAGSIPAAPATSDDTAPWAHPEVMHELRVAVMSEDPAVWRSAIAQALPVLATDQDVQIQVGSMLTGIDGLAWQLLACMHCTLADERLGFECAREGQCDPNLALVDVFRRNVGEQKTADALARMEEIKTAIANGAPLEPFTQLDDQQFPREVGECVQLRTPTPECPPEEIERQTREAFPQ